jgi:hypothetical protein
LLDVIAQLARAERLLPAVKVMAQALPRREAIAWGLEAVRKVEAAGAKAHDASALQTVEEWLAEPVEERRRAAKEAADRAGMGSAAGCLAMAVFFSGGSMAPASAPVAPEPKPHVCGKTVAGAITLAAYADPRNAKAHLRSFLDRGFKWAADLKIWETK